MKRDPLHIGPAVSRVVPWIVPQRFRDQPDETEAAAPSRPVLQPRKAQSKRARAQVSNGSATSCAARVPSPAHRSHPRRRPPQRPAARRPRVRKRRPMCPRPMCPRPTGRRNRTNREQSSSPPLGVVNRCSRHPSSPRLLKVLVELRRPTACHHFRMIRRASPPGTRVAARAVATCCAVPPCMTPLACAPCWKQPCRPTSPGTPILT